ncbi:MAG: endonuclease MutS2 [Ignavibacteriales bacterium]
MRVTGNSRVGEAQGPVFDERTLRVLEYEKIVAMLVERAVTVPGRERAERLVPAGDRAEMARALAETTEAAAIISVKSPPFQGLGDVRGPVRRCAIGGSVHATDLVAIAAAAAAVSDLKRFLGAAARPGSVIHEKAQRLVNLRDVHSTIMESLTDEAEVRDGASPELHRIRSQMRTLSSRVRERLESMVRSPQVARLLQEPIVTIREGRYVLPVKQENRSLVAGVVHDQSASGATVFIEPMAVLEINNEIRRLEAEERDEIDRILRDLSAMVAGHADDLLQSIEAAGEIDFAFAKGRLSLDMNAVEPALAAGYVVDLRKARHPLLKGDVVPTDVHLGRTYDTMIITGPNTGGKTVTLKTVGLLVLMAHSGLHIPAAPGSAVSPFEGVFCDAGDEQSIEQSLSTFSSHMTSIVSIIGCARRGSLVLLDELGAGTDPAEGSALAMAILDYLHGAGMKTIATTHYSELKTFAFTRDRIENASVEFDVETLRPTYRLVIGLPGRSNAFEIATRLGLPEGIIASARGFVGREGLRVEDMIGQIEKMRREAEEDQRAAEEARRAAARLRDEYSRKVRDLKEREIEIREKARTDAIAVVQKAKAQARLAMEKLREAGGASPREREAFLQAARDALREAGSIARTGDEVGDDAGDGDTPVFAGPPPRDLVPGEPVYVKSVGQTGYVLEPRGPSGDVLVQLGIMKMQVNPDDLARPAASRGRGDGDGPAGRPAAAGKGSGGVTAVMGDKARTVSTEIDLRGMTVDEALASVDKYLDDAILGGVPQVRIIHGKGTGALRNAVRDFLRKHPDVSGVRFGGPGEGGDGVSVATLR